MTDLTARLNRDRAQAAMEAVTRSAQTRGVIDQAKGIIMATMDVEEETAFDLLRWHSSHMNIKLRDVAAAVVRHRADLVDPGYASTPRERLTAAIAGLAAAREPVLVAARTLSDPAIDVDTIEKRPVPAGSRRPTSQEPCCGPSPLRRRASASLTMRLRINRWCM